MYILILGDMIDEQSKDGQHPKAPVLLCVDFTLKTWMEIPLRKSNRVEGGRGRAAMLVLGEIGGPFLKLFVFGGVNNVSFQFLISDVHNLTMLV